MGRPAALAGAPAKGERAMLVPRMPASPRPRLAYRPEHVKHVLRGEMQRLPGGMERDRVSEALGRLPSVVRQDRLRREFAGLERYMDRLPRILYLYSRGYSVEDIADRLAGLPTAYGIERTIDIAASLVAEQLNQ